MNQEQLNKIIKLENLLSTNFESIEQDRVTYKDKKTTYYNSKNQKQDTIKVEEVERIKVYNEILDLIYSLEKDKLIYKGKWNNIGRRLSMNKDSYKDFYYYVDKSTQGVMLYVGCINKYKIEFGRIRQDLGTQLTGFNAYCKFINSCKEKGIDLSKYELNHDEGLEIAENTGAGTLILYEEYKDKELDNCYHLDYNSSFPAGLVNTHPEFKPVMEEFYIIKECAENKEDRALAKAVLNYSIGYLHSASIQYRYAGLAKDAIDDNDKRINELQKQLELHNYNVICANIDGVWYQKTKDSIPFVVDLGEGLGQLKVDHKAVKAIFRSAKSYQFIENGIVYTKQSGLTRLDRVQPRDKDGKGWKWLDIYDKDAEVPYYITTDGHIKLY